MISVLVISRGFTQGLTTWMRGFMTLDEQIEAVHNQIFDLQFADEEE